MQVMDKLRQCAEKMGFRLDVPPEFERLFNEAYDSVFKDEDKEKVGTPKVVLEKYILIATKSTTAIRSKYGSEENIFVW